MIECFGKHFCCQAHADEYFDAINYCSECGIREQCVVCDNDCGYGTCESTDCKFNENHLCSSDDDDESNVYETSTPSKSKFIEAIGKNDIDTVKILLEKGEDPNMDNNWHSFCCVSPLAYAIQCDHLEIAKLLIEHGASVLDSICEESDMSSSMSSAVFFGRKNAVEMLFDAGHPPSKDALLLSLTKEEVPQNMKTFDSGSSNSSCNKKRRDGRDALCIALGAATFACSFFISSFLLKKKKMKS
jgi:ankyrin repeat protein